jgi:hypothetical protein
LLVDASVAIGDHGDLAGLLAYEDLCDFEAFLGQLLSPWVVHAERHGSSYPLFPQLQHSQPQWSEGDQSQRSGHQD